MVQSWGGGARGVVTGARPVMTVEVVCGTLVGAAGVLRGLPDALVAVALDGPVPGEEQLITSSEVNRQAQLVEKRDDSPARRGQECRKTIECSFTRRGSAILRRPAFDFGSFSIYPTLSIRATLRRMCNIPVSLSISPQRSASSSPRLIPAVRATRSVTHEAEKSTIFKTSDAGVK